MSVVEVRQHGSRVDIVLNRPDKLNAMDPEVFESLGAAADAAAGLDPRVVVVRGEGRSFSAGIDTSSFGSVAGSPEEGIARAQAGFRKIAALPMPTIAAVQGHALGAGLQLALACDLRVCTKTSSLGLLEHRYGIVPDLGGTQRLPLLVGSGHAKKLIWLAERIDGVEAHRIGLAEVIADDDSLFDVVDDLAQRIADAPPLAVRAAKELVDLAGCVRNEAGMDAEARHQAGLLVSGDFVEAISAFLEGRSPTYKGE